MAKDKKPKKDSLTLKNEGVERRKNMGLFGGDGGTEYIPMPQEDTSSRDWEVQRARQEEKQKRKKRRGLISEEEGGTLGSAPSYRRSILGG